MRAGARRAGALVPAAALLAALVHHTLRHRETILWDFAKDYGAALLFRLGHSPFDNRLLAVVSGETLPYVYPLATTLFFMPLTWLDYPLAALVWLGGSTALLAGLVCAWWRLVPGFPEDPFFPAAAFLMFNLALPRNAVTGNFCTVETALLWAGLLLLMRGRTLPFALLAGIAGSFKLAPLALLGVLLVHRDTRRWGALLLGLVPPALVFGGSYLARPAWFPGYLENVRFAALTWPRSDFVNSTLYSLALRLQALAGRPADVLHGAALLLWGAVTAAIGLASLLALRRLAGRPFAAAATPVVMYSCLAYSLLLPRYSDYNFLLVVPAAWYALRASLPPRAGAWATAIFLVPLPFLDFEGASVHGDLWFGPWGYWNLVTLAACWALMTAAILAGQAAPWPRPGRPPAEAARP